MASAFNIYIPSTNIPHNTTGQNTSNYPLVLFRIILYILQQKAKYPNISLLSRTVVINFRNSSEV